MYRLKRTSTVSSVLVWLAVLVPAVSTALAAPGSGGPPLTDEVRGAIVDAIAGRLVDEYVFPDVAGAMAARLRERFSEGAYDSHTALGGFLDALAEDLQSVQRDPHLGLRLLDDNSPPPSEDGEMSAEQSAFWKEFYDYENYGIYQVSRLEGNIGRIDLRLWPSEELAAGPLIAALELLKGVDALIVDVRRHLGGRAYPAQMVLSYLFEEPIHFATTIDRQKGITREQWTFGIIPGARLAEIPVYVLTSWETASVLHYRRAGNDEQRLVPMIPDWFEFESAELYYVRLRFNRDEAGAVRQLVLCYDNGKEETFAPTNR